MAAGPNTLRKPERLHSRRSLTALFEQGASFKMGALRFIYLFDLPESWVQAPASVAFSATKRRFKSAVQRNLLKRRMREAYRQHKHSLVHTLQQDQRNLIFLVAYNKPYIAPYRSIERAMISGLEKLAALSGQPGKAPVWRETQVS